MAETEQTPAQELRSLRDRSGVSDAEFARLIGVRAQHFYRYMRRAAADDGETGIREDNMRTPGSALLWRAEKTLAGTSTPRPATAAEAK